MSFVIIEHLNKFITCNCVEKLFLVGIYPDCLCEQSYNSLGINKPITNF